MGALQRIGSWFGFAARSEDAGGILPPPRAEGTGFVSPETAVRIGDVYRAVQVYQTAVTQLSLDVERAGQKMTETPALVRRPSVDPETHRSAFLAETVAALRLHGNAYWLKEYGSEGTVINLTPLDPNLVRPHRHETTKRRLFSYDGREDYTTREIQHLKLMRRSGQAYGLGPIQAARVELSGAIDVRDYGGAFYKNNDVPSGVLSTDSQLTPDQLAKYKKAWEETHDGKIRVIGSGLKYAPILLKPSDAQWVEASKMTTAQIARLFGVPASLMLASIEGDTQTYANIEQAWIEFVRFSLMTDLREIEEAFTACLPRGQVARFNLETLLRSDTKTRYEAHQIGLNAGFLTVAEVRAIENLPPLPAGTTATVKEPTNV